MFDLIDELGGPQTMTFGENQSGKMCLSEDGGVSDDNAGIVTSFY